MSMVKIIFKILVLPIFILVLIAQMIGAFFHGMASIVLGIISALFWGLALVGYVFGALTGHETAQMMLVSFGTFIVPQICCWMLNITVMIQGVLGEFLRS